MATVKLERTVADPCMFYNLEIGLIVRLYVDDLVVAVANKKIYNQFLTNLGKTDFQIVTWGSRPNPWHQLDQGRRRLDVFGLEGIHLESFGQVRYV